MALLGTITKQPREVIDFDVDYTTALANRPSILQSATSEVTPAGLTLTSTAVYTNANKVKVIVSGGTSGTTYKVTVLTTTNDGLTYEDEANVIVEEN